MTFQEDVTGLKNRIDTIGSIGELRTYWSSPKKMDSYDVDSSKH